MSYDADAAAERLGQMAPRVIEHRVAHRGGGHAVLRAHLLAGGEPCRITGAHVQNGVRRQAGGGPVFQDHIAHVVGWCAQEQMCGPDAAPHVTAMQDVQPIRDGAAQQRPGEAMDRLGDTASALRPIDRAVAVMVDRPRPQPTPRGFGNARPQRSRCVPGQALPPAGPRTVFADVRPETGQHPREGVVTRRADRRALTLPVTRGIMARPRAIGDGLRWVEAQLLSHYPGRTRERDATGRAYQADRGLIRATILTHADLLHRCATPPAVDRSTGAL